MPGAAVAAVGKLAERECDATVVNEAVVVVDVGASVSEEVAREGDIDGRGKGCGGGAPLLPDRLRRGGSGGAGGASGTLCPLLLDRALPAVNDDMAFTAEGAAARNGSSAGHAAFGVVAAAATAGVRVSPEDGDDDDDDDINSP